MRTYSYEVCVIGGGFTGVAGAIACLAHIKTPFRLVMVEPGSALGRGVAFGGHHPLHLLNVRTRDLTLRASQPGDFLNWAFRQLDQGENHGGLHEGLAHTFLPRQLFGEYVRQRFFEAVDQRQDVDVEIIKATAIGVCEESGGRYRAFLEGGPPIGADVVLLAMAYGLPSAGAYGALPPYEVIDRQRLAGAKSMALIGSGLTMVDVLIGARRDGFPARPPCFLGLGSCPSPMRRKA
jgi:uncharacterized NAD(P)/FAD-binding protein YdhS